MVADESLIAPRKWCNRALVRESVLVQTVVRGEASFEWEDQSHEGIGPMHGAVQ